MRGKNKIQVNLVLLWRRNAMEGKSPAPQPTLSWLVIQVFAPCIDHQKNWYAVTKESCGIIPRFFSQNIFFSRFPDEIFSVSKQDLSVFEKKKQIMIERGRMRYVIENIFWSKHRGGK